MAYEAKVLADSVSPEGVRLTTVEATFPRFNLSEFNTHRVFSRNSASSRAIPVRTQLERVLSDPVMPIRWGANQSGMQAEHDLSLEEQALAQKEWLRARDSAVQYVLALGRIGASGVHKQITNRLLEPFMWHTVIVTATEWENFFALRDNPNAQPEIQHIARMMRKAMDASQPKPLNYGEWHLPLIQPDEAEWVAQNPSLAVQVAVGRCARVSYLTHEGKRDPSKDVELYQRLTSNGHMSPLEHVARPMTPDELAITKWSGNFRGWHQHRKDIANEDDFSKQEQAQ